MNSDSHPIQYYQKEIEHYTEVINADPNSATGYYNRGFAYGFLDNWKEALADWEKAIQLNPRLKGALNHYINHAHAILSNKKEGLVENRDNYYAKRKQREKGD